MPPRVILKPAVRALGSASCRSFSSAQRLAVAAEVKKLGVIGAGQMVRDAAVIHEHKAN